ncbi:MAG: YhcN/YlaJ family sporulation lipoprotein [Paenibacillaceae bacterium]
MVKIGLRLVAIVGLVFALTGCNTNNNDQGTGTGVKQQAISNNRAGVAGQGWDNPRNNNFTPTHNNTKMEISNKIADAITAMDEVDKATVLITNQNAYVAVVLDNGTGYGATGFGNAITGRTGPKMTPNATGNNATTNRMGRRGPGAGEAGISDDLKAAIAKKVRSVQPNVDKVYVSANADFVGRMRGYGERFQNGQPITGMIIEFNTLVNRIFPKAE